MASRPLPLRQEHKRVQRGSSRSFGGSNQMEVVHRSIRVLEDVGVNLPTILLYKHVTNARAHVSRLPPELLAAMFLLVSDMDSNRIGKLPAFSQVCRFWRSVALECGPLWTVLDCWRLDLAQELLPRSRGLPLDLVLKEDGYVCFFDIRRWLTDPPAHLSPKYVRNLATKGAFTLQKLRQ